MSHLKKLSEKLGQHLTPRVLEISTIETIATNKLEQYSESIININKKVKDFLVPSLVQTAKHFGLCSLSLNNVNINQAAFVIHNKLQDNKWTQYEGCEEDYSVYLNPTVVNVDETIVEEFEYCPSLPFIKAKVQRFNKAEVEYMTIDGEYKQDVFEGFKARVFMHEFDHLEATLISSFTVNFGELYCVDPEKYFRVQEVIDKFKERLNYDCNILDDRYLSDPEFKAKCDKFGDKREFFVENIVNEEFDGEMNLGLMDAVKFHLKI